jgi:hypothetical protein
MIGQPALIDPVGRAADQDEAAIAIAAIDISLFVDLQEHTRMAERRTAGNVGRAVAGDTGMGHADGFGRRQHEARDSKCRLAHQSLNATLPIQDERRTIAA